MQTVEEERQRVAEEMADRYGGGLSTKEIAEEYGVSVSTVLCRLHSVSCKMRSMSEAQKLSHSNGKRKALKRRTSLPDDATLVLLYQNGLSMAAIAKKYGVHPNSVLQHFNRIGMNRRSQSAATKLGYASGRRRVTVKRGTEHYMWKDGRSRRDYRKVIAKKVCARCEVTKKLLIHHVDFDYYNNNKDNLQVLCLPCHSSLHKKAYWDAVKAGKKPKVSTGDCHWSSDDKQ